jgi:hypothetical protein
LKFSSVSFAKPPAEVTAADVFMFFSAQRAPRLGDRVVRLLVLHHLPERRHARLPVVLREGSRTLT